jgi:hypothetical protein
MAADPKMSVETGEDGSAPGRVWFVDRERWTEAAMIMDDVPEFSQWSLSMVPDGFLDEMSDSMPGEFHAHKTTVQGYRALAFDGREGDAFAHYVMIPLSGGHALVALVGDFGSAHAPTGELDRLVADLEVPAG